MYMGESLSQFLAQPGPLVGTAAYKPDRSTCVRRAFLPDGKGIRGFKNSRRLYHVTCNCASTCIKSPHAPRRIGRIESPGTKQLRPPESISLKCMKACYLVEFDARPGVPQDPAAASGANRKSNNYVDRRYFLPISRHLYENKPLMYQSAMQ